MSLNQTKPGINLSAASSRKPVMSPAPRPLPLPGGGLTLTLLVASTGQGYLVHLCVLDACLSPSSPCTLPFTP